MDDCKVRQNMISDISRHVDRSTLDGSLSEYRPKRKVQDTIRTELSGLGPDQPIIPVWIQLQGHF